MSIGVTIRPNERDSAELRAAFERLVKLGRSPRPVMGRIGLFVQREARRRLRSRKSAWGPKTTRLSKSIAVRYDDRSVVVGSNLDYAAVQQLGHPGITPKPGRKYLAIPATSALRRRGVWPRDLPKDSMKFVPNASIRLGSRSWIGPALVRATEGADGEVMFALVKRVKIKARPYLVFGRAAQQFALAEFERAYQRAIGGRGKK